MSDTVWIALIAAAAIVVGLFMFRNQLSEFLFKHIAHTDGMYDRQLKIIAAAYIGFFLVVGILTLPYFGLTWDEGLGNLFFGERYLHYFTSFKEVHLDFKAELTYNKVHPLNLFRSPFRDYPNEFPPVADTLSAASMYLFSYILGWMNPVDGFHLFTVVLASLFLWVLYRFAARRIGPFEALLAVLFLSLFPRFWGDMHFNVKDVPETIFFSLVLMTFIIWLEKPTWPRALLTGVLMGLAVGTKANAIFVLPIIAFGIVPLQVKPAAWKAFFVRLKHDWTHFFLMGLTAASLYVASWPWLYANPIQNLKSYWIYILSQGGRTGGANFNLDPLQQVIFSMPEVMLLALLVGLVLALRHIGDTFWRILIIWLIFPVLRAMLPGMVNFDGIRHFLEFTPAAAMIAGYGAGRACAWVASCGWFHRHAAARPALRAAPQAVFVVLLLASMGGIYRDYFPYLHIYYNRISGGLAGARSGWLGLEAGDYWNSSYRQGMIWLNKNTLGQSTVVGMTAGWLVELTSPLFLPPDMTVMPSNELPELKTLETSEHPVFLMFVIREAPEMELLAECQQLKAPVYEIKVDGVPILQIFQFGGAGN